MLNSHYLISKMIFWFNQFLEARAEIGKHFGWLFGGIEDKKNHLRFPDLLDKITGLLDNIFLICRYDRVITDFRLNSLINFRFRLVLKIGSGSGEMVAFFSFSLIVNVFIGVLVANLKKEIS